MASEMMSNSHSRFAAHTDRTSIGFSGPGGNDFGGFGGLGEDFGSGGDTFGGHGDEFGCLGDDFGSGGDTFCGNGDEFVGGSDGHAFGSLGDGGDGFGVRGDDFAVGVGFSGESIGGFRRNGGRWETLDFWVRFRWVFMAGRRNGIV